jgi:hypothetical protein
MYVKNENKNKVHLIIFTYKRAILLEEVLNSIFKNFENKALPIHVIYHKDKAHVKSYDLLKKKWEKKGVIFYERKKINYFTLPLLTILRPLNLLWLVRWPDIFKNFNNFKFLLEGILSNVKSEFISFVPDDQIFYKKTIIPDQAFKIIKKDKINYFYRFFTGDHFKDIHKIPKLMKVNYYNHDKNRFFEWSHNDSYAKKSPLWNYRFTIEGTVFSKEALISLLKPILYHNPITLEGICLWESRFRNFFQNGLSSKIRTAAGYQINNVQNLVVNQCRFYNSELLMKAYLNGYRIIINKKYFDDKLLHVLPDDLFLKNIGNNKILNYNSLIKNL